MRSLLSIALFAASLHAADPAKVLIIGDSISIGYTPAVTKLLAGKAEVTHHEGNAEHTGNGIRKLEGWLGTSKWDAITFNFGLHDLKIMEGGKHQVDVETYEKNLDRIAERLQRTGARLLFINTTPVPEGKLSPLRKAGDEAAYNAAAARVMQKRGIRVVDLHAFAKSRLAAIQTPSNVHFTKQGSAELASVVARAIEEQVRR